MRERTVVTHLWRLMPHLILYHHSALENNCRRIPHTRTVALQELLSRQTFHQREGLW